MKPDVIVIGAGIIGLATAERLLREGIKVTLLEHGSVGFESSWAGGGILAPLCPWNYSDAVTQLARYSAMQFPDWNSDLRDKSGIDPEYQKSGMLILPPYDQNSALAWCSKRNITIKQCMLPEAYFEHSPAKNEQVLYLPDVAQVRNPRLLRALHTRIVQLQGKIIENCTVTSLKTSNNQVKLVVSSCGEFAADRYIVCAGAWSQEILGAYALGLQIKPTKGQMLLFKYDSPPIQTIIIQNDLYLIPRIDGHLLVGSTMENVGFDKQPTKASHDYLLTKAMTILPSLSQKTVIKHWAGLRPGSPNNIPTIGRHPVVSNLFISSGHFRYGVTMAPASAEILVNEIIESPQPFDISAYQMGWYTEPKITL